jgi:hypothetical protein
MYAVEKALCVMIYLPSLMKIGTGIHVILKFALRNLNGRDVGITAGREL